MILWQFEGLQGFVRKSTEAIEGEVSSSHTNPSKFKRQIEIPLLRYRPEHLHASHTLSIPDKIIIFSKSNCLHVYGKVVT